MLDFLKKTESLPRRYRRLLDPSGEFRKSTKAAYLAVFERAYPVAPRGITAMAKALAGAGAIAAILVGVSVYADTANVGVSSPLYSLKRLGENVQLAIAPAQEKIQLQASFANRRAQEIVDLQKKNPANTAIPGLARQLNNDVRDSIAGAAGANLGDGNLSRFCANIVSALADSPYRVRGVSGFLHSRCAAQLDAATTSIIFSDGETGGESSGSAFLGDATGTATGTFWAPPVFPLNERLNGRFRTDAGAQTEATSTGDAAGGNGSAIGLPSDRVREQADIRVPFDN